MYVSRTGTKKNLAGIRARGWRLLVSATGVLRTEGFPYMYDNGAWTNRDTEFDVPAFERGLELLGAAADRVVLPDIVCGGAKSLALSLSWIDRVRKYNPRVLIPAQDGMDVEDLRPLLDADVGVFIGGGDEFKERTAGAWAALARSRGAWCHMGRVNAKRRIAIAAAAGCDSIDGSSASRFSKMHPRINRALSQTSLLVEPTE